MIASGKFFSIAADSSSGNSPFGRTFVLSNWTRGAFPRFFMHRPIGVRKKADVPLGVVLSTTSEIPRITDIGN
jgi:hypothetical protein